MADRAASTSVVIVGAGPAGLTLGNLLHAAGIDCVVLECESREFIEQRPRAGFLEEWAVRALEGHGLADRLLERAPTHSSFEFRLDGRAHVFRYAELLGHHHFVCPQQLLVTDLVEVYADQQEGDIRFGVEDVAVDLATPAVSYTDPETGERVRLACDFIAGCDGSRGVTRTAALARGAVFARRDHGVRWLALLAEAPPSSERVVFGVHQRGFAGHMARGPQITRYYLQCGTGDSVADWPYERVWAELHARLAATGSKPLSEGELVEERVLEMHSYVISPMRHGPLFLTGDAAHLLAPIAAKGMNLALFDALRLAEALTAHYARGVPEGLDAYSDVCLQRAWQYQEFTEWLSELFHGPSSTDPFRAGTSRARLRRLLGSRAAGESFTGLYLGVDADH